MLAARLLLACCAAAAETCGGTGVCEEAGAAGDPPKQRAAEAGAVRQAGGGGGGEAPPRARPSVGPNIKADCLQQDGSPKLPAPGDRPAAAEGPLGPLRAEEHRRLLQRCWKSWLWYFEQLLPIDDGAERAYDEVAAAVRDVLGIDPQALRDAGAGPRSRAEPGGRSGGRLQ
eukprot:TRINITY_DN7134_c0_g1_i1.p2 TRINITY_DN7134_c0_g1~~TRINITY_DN7134_c0_g1_i1.p2  ORF type:complete len:196 (+),score=41.92 TRINITY_DN7134_c0_g1_i1:74-589(+)